MRRPLLAVVLILSGLWPATAHADGPTVEWRRTTTYPDVAREGPSQRYDFSLNGDDGTIDVALADRSGLNVSAEYEVCDQLGCSRSSGRICGSVSAVPVPLDARGVIVRPGGAPGLCPAATTGTIRVTFEHLVSHPYVDDLSRSRIPTATSDIEIEIIGWNFNPETRAEASGDGIQLDVICVDRGTVRNVITARVSAGAGATTGPRDLIDSKGPGLEHVCNGCITVTELPAIQSVAPAEGPAGRSTTVTIRGSGFDPGATFASSRRFLRTSTPT